MIIDTDKYEKEIKKQPRMTSRDEMGLHLVAEVKRLEEVAYLRICLIGERDKEIKRLREGIRQIIQHNEGVDIDMFGSQVSDKLKELIE
tara:strand:- start:1012 stop:1278 length:267 start_codon:yes stop_codon:yes gene_type:complete